MGNRIVRKKIIERKKERKKEREKKQRNIRLKKQIVRKKNKTERNYIPKFILKKWKVINPIILPPVID